MSSFDLWLTMCAERGNEERDYKNVHADSAALDAVDLVNIIAEE